MSVERKDQGSQEYADSLANARRPARAQAWTTDERCADCGAYGETTGHMECQYPQDHND